MSSCFVSVCFGFLFQFALVETMLTSYMDLFPQHRKKKWLVLLVICVVMYLLGLVLCTNVSIGYYHKYSYYSYYTVSVCRSLRIS